MQLYSQKILENHFNLFKYFLYSPETYCLYCSSLSIASFSSSSSACSSARFFLAFCHSNRANFISPALISSNFFLSVCGEESKSSVFSFIKFASDSAKTCSFVFWASNLDFSKSSFHVLKTERFLSFQV